MILQEIAEIKTAILQENGEIKIAILQEKAEIKTAILQEKTEIKIVILTYLLYLYADIKNNPIKTLTLDLSFDELFSLVNKIFTSKMQRD